MSKIHQVLAREILDSRGYPTVEVELRWGQGQWMRAAVPSGASTGAHEALELRDQEPSRYNGKGVRTAVKNVLEVLAPILVGQSLLDHDVLEKRIVEADPSPNKSKLGANAVLGASLALLKAAAVVRGQSLFEFVGGPNAVTLPVPLMNVLNGGAHADNGLDVQEYMIVPVAGGHFSEALRIGAEVFHALKKILKDKNLVTAVGDEGGFAPALKNNEEALTLLLQAIEKAGYKPGQDVALALDVAATEFFKDSKYHWQGQKISASDLIGVYSDWCKKYPIVSIEDGLSEDDWDGWAEISQRLGKKVQLVGDDLFVTNPVRIEKGIQGNVANSVLIKVNQIGSFSETRRAVQIAHQANYHTVMSHRSGETEDVTISDLAVGLGTAQIKTGSLSRGERTAKYNQLLRIQEQLGAKAQYKGQKAFEF
jgi:enolase